MDIHGNLATVRPAYTRVTLEPVKDTHTPHRPIRVEDELWEAFGRLVGPRNRSAILREFIRWYVGARGAKLPRPPKTPPAPSSES